MSGLGVLFILVSVAGFLWAAGCGLTNQSIDGRAARIAFTLVYTQWVVAVCYGLELYR